MASPPDFYVRIAVPADVPALEDLIRESVMGNNSRDYTPEQIHSSLRYVFGVDSQLVADGTYFIVETPDGQIVGCGGWSYRRTLYGGDDAVSHVESDDLLNPATEPAKIRAMFVRPGWERRGIGTRLIQAGEQAALVMGFHRLELMATLTGIALYTRHGFTAVENVEAVLPDGVPFPIIRMVKSLGSRD